MDADIHKLFSYFVLKPRNSVLHLGFNLETGTGRGREGRGGPPSPGAATLEISQSSSPGELRCSEGDLHKVLSPGDPD